MCHSWVGTHAMTAWKLVGRIWSEKSDKGSLLCFSSKILRVGSWLALWWFCIGFGTFGLPDHHEVKPTKMCTVCTISASNGLWLSCFFAPWAWECFNITLATLTCGFEHLTWSFGGQSGFWPLLWSRGPWFYFTGPNLTSWTLCMAQSSEF